jgi:hypothetical protein
LNARQAQRSEKLQVMLEISARQFISKDMKRIILSAIVVAFAVAVQAGDAKPSQNKDKEKPACCASKVKTSEQAKEGTCPFAKSASCKQKEVKQTSLPSPKASN